MRGFLERNSNISVRSPENTSLARAQAFNKENIKAYFSALAKVLDEEVFPPENIYNVDETGIRTVPTKPQKIPATNKLIFSAGQNMAIIIQQSVA